MTDYCPRCLACAYSDEPDCTGICPGCEEELEAIEDDIESERLDALIDDIEPLFSHLRDQREST